LIDIIDIEKPAISFNLEAKPIAGCNSHEKKSQMNSITISEQDKVLVVDSRLIAEELAISHKSFLKTVEKYKTLVESHFSSLRFEISTKQSPSGIKNPNPEYFYWLTEDQSTFIISLSRNTDPVIQCKVKLVKAFSAAKKKLQQPIEPKQAQQLEDLTETQLKAIMMFQLVSKDSKDKLDPAQFLKGIDSAFWSLPVHACVHLIGRQQLKQIEFLQDVTFARIEQEFKYNQIELMNQKAVYVSSIDDCHKTIQYPEGKSAYRAFAASLAPALTSSDFPALDSKPKGFGKPKK
jgi:phage regulator Rha-like protein